MLFGNISRAETDAVFFVPSLKGSSDALVVFGSRSPFREFDSL